MSQVFINTTIADLQAMSGSISEYFYTTDLGQEGNWYYDSTDTTSADNTGTILVSADGKRFKRIYDGSIQAGWFGSNYPSLMNYVNINSNITSLNFDKDIVGSFATPVITIFRDNLRLNFNDRLLSNTALTQTPLIRVGGNNIQINDCNISAPNYIDRFPLLEIYYGNNIKVNGGVIKDSIKAVELSAKDLEGDPTNLTNVSINGLKVNNVVDGIYIGESTDEPRGDITNVIVDGCDIYGGKGTDELTGGDGIKTTRNCSIIRITNNKIGDFKRDAIDLYASGDRVIIYGNALLNSGVKAIDIKSDIDLYPPEDYGKDGIDINITANQILYNKEGISIDRSLTNVLSYNKQIAIVNNNISYNKDLGVFLCGQYVTIQNNFFVGNGYDTDKIGDYAVIRLGNDQLIRIAKNNIISDNFFINNGKDEEDTNYAIRISRYSEGNTICNNEITNETDLGNAVQTCGIYVNQDTVSAIFFNKINVIDTPYTIVGNAEIETNKQSSVTVSVLSVGDTFIKKADSASFIKSAIVTSTEDLAVNATDNIVITLVRVRSGIETTLGFYTQGSTGLPKFTGFAFTVSPTDSIVVDGDIHVARIFRTGTPMATRPLNMTVSYF